MGQLSLNNLRRQCKNQSMQMTCFANISAINALLILLSVLSRKWNRKNIDIKDKIYKSHQKEC